MIRKTTDKSRGIRLGNFVQIRTMIDEELEQVWAGKKSAKEALDAQVQARRRCSSASRRPTRADRCAAQGGAKPGLPDPSPPCPQAGGPCQRTILGRRKTRPLQELVAALGAGGTAGPSSWCSSSGPRPGAVLQRAAAGRVRHQRRVRGLRELRALFADETYLASFKTTAVFSFWWRCSA
jgi:hypothetical protein